jgi:tripartite-type tricarboxylate transporter receptor subunit TctC
MRSIAALLFLVAVPNLVFAQEYPSRPVRIIVAYTPGGGTDLAGRVLAKKLGEVWNQQVIVENRPGAGGNIGTDAIAKAAPDGYTLGVAPSTHAIVPRSIRNYRSIRSKILRLCH